MKKKITEEKGDHRRKEEKGDHSGGPRQRTRAVGEGGPAHADDTIRGVLQPRWRTGSPWLLDRCYEEAGRSNPHRPLTSNDVYPQWCIAINSNICLHIFTFALMMTEAFSRNVGKLFSEV